MSYHIEGDVLQLDIKIPEDRISEALEVDEDFGGYALRFGAHSLDYLTGGEDHTVVEFPKVGNYYHLTRRVMSSFGGNKAEDDEILAALAEQFSGTFEARTTGEDGSVDAVKVVKGVRKKVRVMVVEED